MTGQSAGVRAFERFAELFRHESEQLASERERHVSAHANRRVDDDAALAGRKWRHVCPATREIKPHRRAGVKFGREIAPPHYSTRQAAIVGSSPRMSMRTPCTRLFIACTPRV